MNLDDVDWRILRVLQTDASISNQALSERVFVSPATALRRVRALADTGVIERITASLSPEKLGGVLNAICEVSLDVQNAETFDAFEAVIDAINEVTQCYRTSPGVDFTLMLAVRDMAHYQALSQTLFTAANNVRNVRARFVTKRSKFTTALPI
jgi:Lrp/AsnC family transcriptional regulator, leucine-responsive regulatory protein